MCVRSDRYAGFRPNNEYIRRPMRVRLQLQAQLQGVQVLKPGVQIWRPERASEQELLQRHRRSSHEMVAVYESAFSGKLDAFPPLSVAI